MSMQYQLTEANVGKLYSVYRTNYENNLKQWAEAAIRDTVGKFNNTDFWTARKESAKALQ